MWVQGLRTGGPLLLLFQAYYQDAGLKVKQLGLELAPVWVVGTSGSSLMHYATTLAPELVLGIEE